MTLDVHWCSCALRERMYTNACGLYAGTYSTWHSRLVLILCLTTCVWLSICFFEKTIFVIFEWQFILLWICCVISPTRVLNQSVQSLMVNKWKWVIISSPNSAQTCYIWHSVFIGICPCSAFSFTPSSLLRFPFPPPPTSLLSFLPAPFPLLPSFLCLLLLPWFTFNANFYPFFVKLLFPHSFYCVCLITKEQLGRGKREKERKGEVTHHVDWQLSGKYDFRLTARLCVFSATIYTKQYCWVAI